MQKRQSALAAEQGFAHRWAIATYARGQVLVRQGKVEGIELMKLGLKGIEGTSDKRTISYYLSGLAEGYALAGQSEQALNLLAEALAMVAKTGDRFWEAELYRLRGEFLFRQHKGTVREPTALLVEVERSFLQAIESARRQQAKSWELRATTSLCRLWQAQGKRAEAYALLSEIYGWFSEGFDTGDLIEAKALLEALQ